ncbi:MAG: hypothetical protein ABIP17_03975 [Ilumatobacteraceae bacterium]
MALALAITVILVPAAFLLNRGAATDDAVPPTNTFVGTVVIPGQVTVASTVPVTDDPAATDAMGSTAVAYLDGTVPAAPADPATIAIPRPGESITGSATFSRAINDPKACQVRDLAIVPFNATVTITNLDNSRSVQCIASISGIPDHSVVLNADAFLQIGDLTDAPLSVEITW